MREWSDPINSFNSWKVSYHIEQLKKIARGDYSMPPVITDIDISNNCNSDCVYCNSKEFRRNCSQRTMPKGHIFKILDFIADWGIKAICWAGGGEPLLNPELMPALYHAKKLGFENSVVTNGILLDRDYLQCFEDNCRYLGISIDSFQPDIYQQMRRANLNKSIADIISPILEYKSRLEVSVKINIHPYNYRDLFNTAKIAKEINADQIHFRPVSLDNVPGVEPVEFPKDYVSKVYEELEKARGLECDSFKVYTILHKFSVGLGHIMPFEKCRATPISIVFSTDGNCYLCTNNRGKQEFRLCSHYPDPENIRNYWNGSYHKKLILDINPQKCMRCTYILYNQLIERGILKDKWNRNFL